MAALAAGGSDTVASEIGKAWGRRTYSVPRLRACAAGHLGRGLARGDGGRPGCGARTRRGRSRSSAWSTATLVWLAAAGAFVASWVESALGATLEAPGILDNDLLNFINTTVAAIVAVSLARTLL